MKQIHVFCLAGLLFLGISSASAQFRVTPVRPASPSPSPFAERNRAAQTYRQQSNNLLHDFANLQADYRLLHEEMQKMAYRLRDLESSCQKLQTQNRELQALVTAMDVQNIQRQKDWEEKIASLQAAIRREGSQRSADMEKMSSNVVNLISEQQKSGRQGGETLPPSGKWVELKIEPGDTLGKIAKSAGITVQQLKSMNQLKNDRIFVGQVLKVPVP